MSEDSTTDAILTVKGRMSDDMGKNLNVSHMSFSPVNAMPPNTKGFYDVFGNASVRTSSMRCLDSVSTSITMTLVLHALTVSTRLSWVVRSSAVVTMEHPNTHATTFAPTFSSTLASVWYPRQWIHLRTR